MGYLFPVMETITHNELIELLASRKGTTFIGIDALTDSGALKTGNPFPGKVILKQSRAVATVGADYGSAVNREIEKAGGSESFEAQSLPWGEWSIPGKVISHKGEFYLRTQTIPRQRRNRPAVVKYRDREGRFLSRDAVSPYLPKEKESAKQEKAGLEGVESQVKPRNFKFSSLLRVRVNGKTFKVVPA